MLDFCCIFAVQIVNNKVFIDMEKKLITETEMKELLKTNTDLEDLDKYCVDIETARKIIKDAVLPLCK